jgi:uncharacterized membrane protein YtjA (UPF0391 family)
MPELKQACPWQELLWRNARKGILPDEATSLMEVTMVGWALTFLVIGLIAALLGFTTIAGVSFAIAKFLAALFLILFLVFLILGLTAARKIVG